MRIIYKILGVFGIRRIILDKPLTLLGQDSGKVLDKINESREYGWVEYVLKDSPRQDYDNCWWKGRRKASAPRTVGEERQRIMRDVSENL